MANQEVVNAINETMVPNGVKAINADSVRNLLLLMAEKMGEGGGSGAVRVHIIAGQELDFSQVNFEEVGPFTPEEVELIKNMLAKAQQDNKAAYKLLNEHREQGIADLVMGDESLFMTFSLISIVRLFEASFKEEYSYLDWSAFSFNGVAGYPMYYSNAKTDTSGIDADSLALLDELLGDMATDVENSQFNGIVLSYDAMLNPYYVLKEDGSVFYFEDTSTEEENPYEPIIYLSGENGELTEDMIEANKRATNVSEAYIGVHWSVRQNYKEIATGSHWTERGGCVHEIVPTLDHLNNKFTCFRFWKEKNIMQVSIDKDGNATIEVYASINQTATE